MILAYFYPQSILPYVVALLAALFYTKRKTDEGDDEVGKRTASLAYTVSLLAFSAAILFGEAQLRSAIAVAFLISVTSYWLALAYYYKEMG